jgi:hypothetical protein
MKDMLIKEVESSSIKTVSYDKVEQKLWIRFQNDNLYEYRDVEKSIVDGLLEADSKGLFFANNIKSHYDFEKVEDES